MQQIKYIVILLLVIFVFFGCASISKPDYTGISYSQLNKIRFKIEKGSVEDYGSKKVVIFAGKKLSKRWRADLGLVLARLREVKMEAKNIEGELYGTNIRIIFDQNIYGPLNFYTSINIGVAYIHPRFGWEELESGYVKGQFGGQLGTQYQISKKFFLSLGYELWHVSDFRPGDQGHDSEGPVIAIRVLF